MGIVGEFLVLEGVCMVIQMYTQRLILTGFGLALGLVFLYLTINNPGDYVDSITGVFDKQYFDKWIEEKLDKKAEFHLIATEFYMLKQVNKVYGSSVGAQMLIQAAAGNSGDHRFFPGIQDHGKLFSGSGRVHGRI